MDASFKVCDSKDSDLMEFFRRPVEIYSFKWDVDTYFKPFRLYPWTEYFLRNTLVKQRIKQYSLLRTSHICIKILLNGNPFYMGRMIASYIPTGTLDQLSLGGADGAVNTGISPSRLTQITQRPHVFLNPSNSEGGSLRMPFFCRQNYVNLHGDTLDQMGALEFDVLNILKYSSSTSNVPNTVLPIRVYVWMENTELNVPTLMPLPALSDDIVYEWGDGSHPILPADSESEDEEIIAVMQAGDEYTETGVVSKVATDVALISSKLSSIPVIGPYARASELFSSGVAAVAALFGWSRPIILSVPQPYNPRPVGMLTNTNVDDGSVKLTTDVKQEVTVDPRTTGLGNLDELTLSGIASRLAYAFTMTWEVAATTDRTCLGIIAVNPFLFNKFTTAAGFATSSSYVGLQLLPCGFAALPFSNWRGSMVYRFQVVSPRFTRGRIKISYDPIGLPDLGVEDIADVDINAQYTRIVDISDTTDFTLTVGWGSAKPVLSVNPPVVSTMENDYNINDHPFTNTNNQRFWYNDAWGTWPLKDKNVQHLGYNGIITITTVTNLHNPLAVGDVKINVYAGCGENIEFFNPNNYVGNLSTYPVRHMVPPSLSGGPEVVEAITQAGVDGPEPLSEADYGAPLGGVTTNLAPMLNDTSPQDNMGSICFGEAIVSFRSLMKRYNYYTTVAYIDKHTAGQTPTISRGWHFVKCILSAIPAVRGMTEGANSSGLYKLQDRTVNDKLMRADLNFTVLFTYVSSAFLGWRGGHRWKIHSMRREDTQASQSSLTVTRVPYDSLENVTFSRKGIYVGCIADTTYAGETALSSLQLPFYSGNHMTDTRVNPYLEVEIPYHQQTRFQPARRYIPDYYYLDSDELENNTSTFATEVVTFNGKSSPAVSESPVLQKLSYWHASSDDMNFFFFIGVPTFFISLTDAFPLVTEGIHQFDVTVPYGT